MIRIGLSILYLLISFPVLADNEQNISAIAALSALGEAGNSSIDPGIRALLANKPVITQSFFHDDNQRFAYQCGNQGVQYTQFGDFSQPIRINTDNSWGGCLLSYGIVDPTGNYKDIKINVTFKSTIPGSPECGNENTYDIPVTANRETRTPAFRLNMDDGPAKCELKFDVLSQGTELDLEFYSDDEGVDQCENATAPGKWHTAKLGQPVTLILNTNSSYGGCQFRHRLKR